MKKSILLSLLSLFTLQLFAQCVSGDCQNGKGTYIYPSGAKYIGEFQDGEIHGVGICFYTNGSKYSGQWTHRYPEGTGTKTYADGTKKTGEWLKGKPVDEDGNIMEDIVVAKGEERNDDGTDIQTGCISGDCENGQGVFAYADGSKYEGDFKNGNLEGNGIWHFTDGNRYEGGFKNNYSHGSGKLFHTDGEIIEGEWQEGEYIGTNTKDGKLVEGCNTGDCINGEGTYVYKDGEAKYVGEFQAGMPNGSGSCYYSNGERYEGSWAGGSFNGMGTLFLLDGTEAYGFWKDGTFIGKEDPRKVEQKVEIIAADDEEEEIKEMIVEQAENIKVWAVVIGVSSYSHMPALRYTDDDAYRMYAFLKSPEGGALGDDQIRILIDEDATKQKITNAMTETFSQASANDLIILYFSGHGLQGSFLPIDFDGFNNKLYHDEINEILRQSKAKYKLCIADACHSGSLLAIKSGTAENALSKYYKSLAQAQAGTALIMSSKSSETSLESSGLRQGVFSHFLIRGLKGEPDYDKNEVISVKELYAFIAENVKSYTGNRQSPVIKGDFDELMTVGVIR